ncbi:unnamed protein product [Phaeothamnion confervicola]
MDLRGSLRQRAALSDKVDALSEELARADASIASLTSRLHILRAANGRLERRALGCNAVMIGDGGGGSSTAGRRRSLLGNIGGTAGGGGSGGGNDGGRKGSLKLADVEALVRQIRSRANAEVREARVEAEAARAAALAAETNLRSAATENVVLRRRLAGLEEATGSIASRSGVRASSRQTSREESNAAVGAAGAIPRKINGGGPSSPRSDSSAAAVGVSIRDLGGSVAGELSPPAWERQARARAASRARGVMAAGEATTTTGARTGAAREGAGMAVPTADSAAAAGASAAASETASRASAGGDGTYRGDASDRLVDRVVGAVVEGDEEAFLAAVRTADAATRRYVLRLLDESAGGAGGPPGSSARGAASSLGGNGADSGGGGGNGGGGGGSSADDFNLGDGGISAKGEDEGESLEVADVGG